MILLISLFTEWKNSGGFTFHQMTPSVSDKMVNPAKDSGLNMEISTANKYTAACLTPSVCSSTNNTANIYVLPDYPLGTV